MENAEIERQQTESKLEISIQFGFIPHQMKLPIHIQFSITTKETPTDMPWHSFTINTAKDVCYLQCPTLSTEPMILMTRQADLSHQMEI